jgi:YHS domain-containing protein
MMIRIAPIAKCLMASTAGGLMLAQISGWGSSEAAAQQPSPIQQELQKLYESEGRQAPDMRLEALPRTTPDGRVFETVPESELPAQPQVQQQPAKRGLLDKLLFWKKSTPPPTPPRVRVVQPSQPAVRPNATAPTGPQYQPGGPSNFQRPQQAQPSSTAERSPVTPRQAPTYQQPRPFPVDPELQAAPIPSREIPVRSASQPRIIPNNSATRPHPLALPTAPPAEFDENSAPARPFPGEQQPAAKLPDLDALPEEPLPLTPEPVTSPEPANPFVDELFPDPFTEVSEEDADRGRKASGNPRPENKPQAPVAKPAEQEQLPVVKPKAKPESAPTDSSKARPFPDSDQSTEGTASESASGLPVDDANENPFSGLKLEAAAPIETSDIPSTDDAAAPKTNASGDSAPALPLDETNDENVKPQANRPATPDLGPDNEFDLSDSKPTPERPLPGMPKLEKIPPGNLGMERGHLSWEEEQARQAAKLKLIAARKGETGLKGFCIVALRDERDLKDALPQFRSTYNLRTYHFSNLEAKIEFDKNPKKYVPAYDGNDPVQLSTESEEREGSLDTALWFKGRLYLFVNHEQMQAFQNDPVLYAEY